MIDGGTAGVTLADKMRTMVVMGGGGGGGGGEEDALELITAAVQD